VRTSWLVAGLGVAYVAGFGGLYSRIGDATVALSALPLVIAGWTYGLRGGLLTGAIVVVANIALMQTIGGQDGFRVAQVPRAAVALVLGACAGWAGDSIRRQRELLEDNRRMTAELCSNQETLAKAVVDRTAELVRSNESLVAETAARRNADARAATADRLAVIGTLTAGIGHEINNPLAAVSANLEYIEDELRDPPPLIVEALADARSAARRAAEIVRHMRVFIQSNASVDQRSEVRGVIESSVRMVAHQIRHRARLEVDIADTPAVALAPAHLGQILLNLLVNASQALPERPPDQNLVRVRVRALPDVGRVSIEVTDSGSGISTGVQQRIFDPFFSTKPGTGTGLGLWVSHQIVAAAGGAIVVESSSDRGSTFRVELPTVLGDDDEALIGATHAALTRRIKLLVIDDDPDVGRAIDRLMAGRHDLVVREDARQALADIAAGQRYDVILCDVMMPALGGVDFFARLQTIAAAQAERVIFMTGGTFVERATEFIHGGNRRVLEKPFEAKLLEAAIRDVLEPDRRPVVHS
jgi:signal transduction histidine kinase/CheY-like chemotaxis protein